MRTSDRNMLFGSPGLETPGAQTPLPAQGAGEVGQAARSLTELFRMRAAAQPDSTAYITLIGDDLGGARTTYAQLDLRARAIAARLLEVARPGERALLLFDSGMDYVATLAGCLYAGVVAVPVYPPDPFRFNRTWPRLEAIANDAETALVLTTANDAQRVEPLVDNLPSVRQILATETIADALATAWQAPDLQRDSLAILQYTSGSTGTPKGVVLRHEQILQNLGLVERAFDVPDAVGMMWLPMYHDMGLIGGVFQAWYSGRPTVLMSPVTFMQRPLHWLAAIHRYRATTTAGPDFAFDLCTRRIDLADCQRLDLSCLRVVVSGGEPVRAATIDRFVEKFGRCGIRRDVFRPAYGMAEATLYISSPRLGRGLTVQSFDASVLAQSRAIAVDDSHPNARRLVACGSPAAGLRMRVVEPEAREVVASGRVGEIWVSGPNIASGYWQRSAETAECFQATLSNGDGPYLRTGDLGFVHDGELFVTGRLKDLIILNGQNHHPEDLERTVEASDDALRPYGGATFAIERDGRERVVVVHEVSRPRQHDLGDIANRVRLALLEHHDLVVDHVVLISAGSLPKTSSGKVQRSTARESFLKETLRVLHEWHAPQAQMSPVTHEAHYVAPCSKLESQLAETWSEVLGLPRIGRDDNFFDLGGHSLLATQLLNRVRARFAVSIELPELFERPTVAALAERIDQRRQTPQQQEADLLAKLEAMSEHDAQAILDDDAKE